MTNELLKNYFEGTCSEEDIVAVENWLTETQNQQEFESFLESYWQEHVEAQSSASLPANSKEMKRGTVRHLWPRLAAAAAVLVFLIGIFHYLTSNRPVMQSARQTAAKAIVKPEPAREQDSSAVSENIPEKTIVHSSKTKHHDEKTPSVAAVPKENVANKNIASNESPRKSIEMYKMSKVIINEVALNKLDTTERMEVLNRLALSVNINDASFQDIAATLRDKYGIVLELCADNNGPDVAMKNYTAHFSEVTFPELIDDMSKQMLFSYTFTDKKTVRICFN